jgi:Ni/Fe-hydrogenase subunit HybB-like protein
MYHLEGMAKLLIAVSMIVGYAYGVEFFIAWYAGNPFEAAIFNYRPTGDYAVQFWIMVICNTVIPLFYLFKKVRTSLFGLFVVALLVNVGMWFERFNIIVSSLAHEFMPHSWGLYSMTWVEWAILVGSFGFFFLLYLSFIKVLPAISIAEVKESMPHPVKGAHSAGGEG